ncbi:MAG: sodium/proton-translocating pyrophosphatase, partial [Polyangiaceae bacterium]
MHRRLGASVANFVAGLFGWAFLLIPSLAHAAQPHHGGEADLVLPDLGSVEVLGMSGSRLLELGMIVAALGLVFGVVTLLQVKNLPTHKSMAEVSQIIWETCKTYLITQGKFIMLLEVLIGAIIVLYFGVLQHMEVAKVAMILGFSIVGILGSYGVAWFGIRIN